jgi:Phosphodiester glycosidase
LSYYPAMRLLAILVTLVSQPFVGITYIDRTETSPRPVHMHIVQIDLAVPGLRFKLSPPAGGREVVRQTTLDYLTQEGAQVAINAHYFLPFPSADREAWLIGIAASEGRVYSAFETPEQSFALVRDAAGLNIDRENHAVIVHRRLRRGFGGQGSDNGTEVVEPVTLWTTVSGSAQIVTDGVKTVPTYKDAQHVDALLDPGGPGTFSNQKSWYEVATARTAVGLSRDGRTLTLFTVDVRGGSEGMRVGEVADVLVADYGVWNALNLDGGGSTSMAMEDPVTHLRSMVNVSSDRENPGGRSVGSSLVVFAPPVPKSPVP